MKGSTPIQSVSINGWALRYQLLHSVEAETGKNSFDASIVKGKPIEIHQELDKRSHTPLKTWSAVFGSAGPPCRRFRPTRWIKSCGNPDIQPLISLRVNTGASGCKKGVSK